jgi:hypothetical protein
MMYNLKVLEKSKWPAPRVVDEMYMRGYMPYITQKASYGFEAPPLLDERECQNWATVLRLVSLKSK